MRTDAVDLHDEASAEYDAAFDWYLQRSPDAALKFDAEVEHALSQIVEAPQRWAVGPHSTRRFLLRKFPFIVIYRERPSGVIQIVAVAHQPQARILEAPALNLPVWVGHSCPTPLTLILTLLLTLTGKGTA